ncbi:MAG: hypothetical protein IKV85_10555 [Ruminococcus sp.]|nr:hypothetical protein [Ruminococcus sp.]
MLSNNEKKTNFFLFPTIGAIIGTISCIYTDSIPLFALFFKLLSPVLPETFQYAGIWGVFNFTMQGFSSVMLLQKFSRNPFFCLPASICYIISPTIMQRLYGHDSLSAHWLIILAFVLWAYQTHKWKHKFTPVLLWAILVIIAVSIHMYLWAMVCIVMVGSFITYLIKNKKIGYILVCGSVSIVCSFVTMLSLGAFHINSGFTDGGLGLYSSNLNTFFNPMGNSSFFKKLEYFDGQGEGFGYLGLGIITAGIIAFSLLIYFLCKNKNFRPLVKKYRAYIIGGAIVFIASLDIAVSPDITLNNNLLLTREYPQIVISALSVFRASGRFIWICDYMIYTAIFMILSKVNSRKILCVLISIISLVQMVDLYEMMKKENKRYNKKIEYVSPLYSEEWQEILEGVNEIRYVPLPPDHRGRKEYMKLGVYAGENGIPMSSFYCAREDYAAMSEYSENSLLELENGDGRKDILYIFFDEERIPRDNEKLKIYEIDGITAVRTAND